MYGPTMAFDDSNDEFFDDYDEDYVPALDEDYDLPPYSYGDFDDIDELEGTFYDDDDF